MAQTITIPRSMFARFGGTVSVGANGVFTKIPVGVAYVATDAEVDALNAAGVPIAPSAGIVVPEGMIYIPRSRYGNQLPISVNGRVTYLPTATSIVPTADQLNALRSSGIDYLLPSSGVTPTPSPTPTPTPTPSGAAYQIVLLIGQSNMAGRGTRNTGNGDTDVANVKQFPDIVADNASYRTIRDSIYPLYHPEDHRTDGEIGPGQSIGKTIAATLASDQIVLLVPCAWGSTGILAGGQWPVGGSLYEAAIAQTNAAIAAAKVLYPNSAIHSIHQVGHENDGNSDKTALNTAWRAMIADARSRITGASTATPWVIGSMLPEGIDLEAGKQAEEQMLLQIAADLPNVFYVPGPYGTTITSEGPSFIHYAAAGCRSLGVQMGKVATAQHSVSFGKAMVSLPEGNTGTTNFIFEVWRTNASGAVVAPITFLPGDTNADDYAGAVLPSNLSTNWVSGSNRTTVTIGVNAGTILEADELFSMALVAPSGYAIGTRPTVTGKIINDDVDNSGAVDADGYPAAGLIATYDASKTNTLYQDAGRTIPAVNDGDPILAIADPGGVHHGTVTGTAVVATVGGKRGIAFNGTNTRLNTNSLVSTLGATIPNYMSTNAGFAIHVADFLTAEASVTRAAWSSGVTGSGTSRRTLSHDGGSSIMRYADRSSGGTLVQPTFGTTVRGAKTVISLRKKVDGTIRVLQDGVIIFDAVSTPQVQASLNAFVEGARLNAGTYDQYLLGTRFARRFYTEQSDADFLNAHNRMRALVA